VRVWFLRATVAAAAAVLGVLGALSNSPSSGDERQPPPATVQEVTASPSLTRVLYVGDSLAWQTADPLRQQLPGVAVDLFVYGGTAPCDWVDRVAAYADVYEPDVVLFSFLGNNLTEPTGHATGGALLSQYRDDLHEICAIVAPARCVAVGQPALGPGVPRNIEGDQPTTMYREEAAGGSWEFVDAGAAVESALGGFDPRLRAADGVHLTDEGAARFAAVLAAYLLLGT
jgi:hypothetical protein